MYKSTHTELYNISLLNWYICVCVCICNLWPLLTLKKEEDHEVIQSSFWSGQIHALCGTLWHRGTRWAVLFPLHSCQLFSLRQMTNANCLIRTVWYVGLLLTNRERFFDVTLNIADKILKSQKFTNCFFLNVLKVSIKCSVRFLVLFTYSFSCTTCPLYLWTDHCKQLNSKGTSFKLENDLIYSQKIFIFSSLIPDPFLITFEWYGSLWV